MRTSALILLLIAMLAPRLTAALPHALACAGNPAMAASQSVASSHAEAMSASASHHDHHQMMMAADDSRMAEHQQQEHQHQEHQHQQHSADALAGSDNAGQDCQHCGQCDEHCSAVVITALPLQQTRPGAEPPLSANAGQRAGFSHDLNRPPRTASV